MDTWLDAAAIRAALERPDDLLAKMMDVRLAAWPPKGVPGQQTPEPSSGEHSEP
jgi:hypothetical protein